VTATSVRRLLHRDFTNRPTL